MARTNPKTNEELAAELPALIEKGIGLYCASRELCVGMPRLRKLASKEQIDALKKNGEAGRIKSNVESESRIKSALAVAVEQGYSLNKARIYSGTTCTRFYELATPEQIEAFKQNSAKLNKRKGDTSAPREGMIVITDQAIARALMQDIIATHPAIGRYHV